MAYWCRKLVLDHEAKLRIRLRELHHLKGARKASQASKRLARGKYLVNLRERNAHLAPKLEDVDVGKIALAMLYFGEGGKNIRKARVFIGNSDPAFIRLFLDLFRRCYILDEKKFRLTVMCRADQNTSKLTRFWSKVTSIPLSRCYPARIDPRTVGKPTLRPNYKGVCCLDYFSAEVFNELLQLIKLLSEGR
ncbi:hypothetical protein HY633_01200 [Candidatus Uhrbacteria bacterium]|nr:hypothetical protein [Candidatus Uhrbacteria bacterium]